MDRKLMDTLPDEIVGLIYSFVRPSWLRLCDKRRAGSQPARRALLIAWMRRKRAHGDALFRLQELKKQKFNIENYGTYNTFRQKDATDARARELEEEIADLRVVIDRIHHSIQLIGNKTRYSSSYLHARWNAIFSPRSTHSWRTAPVWPQLSVSLS